MLVEILLQSCDDLGEAMEDSPFWERTLSRIEENIELPVGTVRYWSCLGDDLTDTWRVTPGMRKILARHRSRFESPAAS